MGRKARERRVKYVNKQVKKIMFIEHLDESVYGKNQPYLMKQYDYKGNEADLPDHQEIRMSQEEYDKMKTILTENGWVIENE